MLRQAREGAPLDELVCLAWRYCTLAEAQLPRIGPGAKPTIPDRVLAVMVTVGVLLRKKSKNAQYVWWREHQQLFRRFFGGVPFPGRSTFYDRYRRIWSLFQKAIAIQGQDAVEKGWADSKTVAIDKSLIAGRGRRWSPHDRRRNIVPKRVDPETTWGYSQHDGWVQGYAFETVVTAGNGVSWPLTASCDTASRSEQKTCLEKLRTLPPQTVHVLADAGYDSNAVAEIVEQTGDGHSTGRHFLCPEVPRPNKGKPRQKHSRQSQDRQRHRRLREKRRGYFLSTKGRRLYARRKSTVEPFNSHLKMLFELEDRVWHWKLDNNRTMILAAIFAYQTLLTLNHHHHRLNRCIKTILDRL